MGSVILSEDIKAYKTDGTASVDILTTKTQVCHWKIS